VGQLTGRGVDYDHDPVTTQRPEPLPFEPSALNRFQAAVDRLPGGGWWIYPLLWAALVAYMHVFLWISGHLPVGSVAPDAIVGVVYGPYALAASHYLFKVAGRAIAAFRPASGWSDEQYARRRYEIGTLPAGRLWIPLGIGVVLAVGSVVYASADALAPYGGTVLVALAALGPAALYGYAAFPVVIWQTLRQLRLVEQIHREATAIDLADTAPIFAFSRLTVGFGLAFVVAGYYSLTVNAAFQAGNPVSVAIVASTILVGIACFIVPLWGIHGRLVAEKAGLVRGVNLRARLMQEELYRRVDAANLVGVKEVTDGLAGIYAARDQINRLPTWPWPPQVLRGFLSAILLPVIVFLITRYVGTQIR
jgi:hypothetical protein